MTEEEMEYAVAREEWPSVPVYRKRTLEAAQALVEFPRLGEKKHGWIVIARPKPTTPEWKRV